MDRRVSSDSSSSIALSAPPQWGIERGFCFGLRQKHEVVGKDGHPKAPKSLCKGENFLEGGVFLGVVMPSPFHCRWFVCLSVGRHGGTETWIRG